MTNINFGIDLGTTNSGIGKYENGKVQVLKNPVGLHEILSSVVSFRKGRIIVGDKAREQYLSNPENVFSAFKRKMGTTERYPVTGQPGIPEVSPIELSAYILKELQNYVYGNVIDAAVITVPASFDTIQANATKEAAAQAGFREVVLLQEPIAACLAYANLSHLNLESEQKWLVYDFGGGTFDTALVHINQRELKVIDNMGNNFLGGVDIDYAFISQLIIPKLAMLTGDTELLKRVLNREGVYEKLWFYLNYLAEEAKKQLSISTTAFMEINFPELEIDVEFEIDRASFNKIVKPKYLETETFVYELLLQNNLSFNDIERIVLVGGTTYIPFIKDELKKISQTIVDDSIDPTTAVIVGAAYYAGAFPKTTEIEAAVAKPSPQIDVKLSFETYSNDQEELIAFKTDSPFNGYYRITRADGGFDSGLRPFSQTASEFVSLLSKTKNIFRLDIFDAKKNQTVYSNSEISIAQGLYSIGGQLLPNDICIELDGRDGHTYLEAIFKRNGILPMQKTLYKTFTKSIVVSADDKIVINVVEGKAGTLPGANLSIGYIELSGKEISGDLIQGTELELKVSMDESRGLTVEIYIPTTGQEMKHTFHIASREVNAEKIFYDIVQAEILLRKEIAMSNKEEAYELSAVFQHISKGLLQLKTDLEDILGDQVTAEKYRIDERKRKLIGELDDLTRAREVYGVLKRYREQKEIFINQKEHALTGQTNDFENIVGREAEFLKSNDRFLIERITVELTALNKNVSLQNAENFVAIFFQFKTYPLFYYKEGNDIQQLFVSGDKFVDEKNYNMLKPIVTVLYSHLKDEYKQQPEKHFQHMPHIKTTKMGLR